ncbi:hypothetical protein FI667_g12998, partial [Globisporangium splendens]
MRNDMRSVLFARSPKIQRAQSVDPLPLVPAPVSPPRGTGASTTAEDHARDALESDIHILTLSDFLREQPMDWCMSMNDSAHPAQDKLVMTPSTQLSPESPCSVAFQPPLSPTPLAFCHSQCTCDAHFTQMNPARGAGAAQDRKARFLETDGFYIKSEYIEDPNTDSSSSCDSEGGEDKERRRKRQRGYEKAYRVKKREEHKRMQREWIQLESQLYSKRAQQAHTVQFKNMTTCTARDRLWQLYQEERALHKDRIAIITAGRWETFFLIQKIDDKNAKLKTMCDWEALSDISLGMSLTKPFIPPPVAFSWDA